MAGIGRKSISRQQSLVILYRVVIVIVEIRQAIGIRTERVDQVKRRLVESTAGKGAAAAIREIQRIP